LRRPLDPHFLRNPSLWALAKLTVYTEGLTPRQVRDEVLARVS